MLITEEDGTAEQELTESDGTEIELTNTKKASTIKLEHGEETIVTESETTLETTTETMQTDLDTLTDILQAGEIPIIETELLTEELTLFKPETKTEDMLELLQAVTDGSPEETLTTEEVI